MKKKNISYKMEITEEWLKEQEACKKGIEWFKNQEERNPVKLIQWFIENEKHLDWANWLIVRIMDYKQYVSYAVYAAEQVLDIFQNSYPDDSRPRKTIKAARKCIEDPSERNKADAANYVIAYVADAATYAADAACCAANAACCAADAACDAADAAADAADYASIAAACDAADYDAAYDATQIKILQYGLKII